jgi:uncharacterized damage-inducible protein DinB
MARVDHRDALRHMEWADARTWSAALAVPSLQGNPAMRNLLLHYHITQRAYLQLFRGEPVDIPDPAGFADLTAVSRWVRVFYRELPAFLDSLDDAGLDRRVDFPWAAEMEARFGKISPATVAESLEQLILHTAHHRGQVLTKISVAGGKAPLIDYIAWVWLGRPEPDWSGIGGD